MFKILIGLILVLFSFNVHGLDVLPDFVGYIFILLGLNDLKEKSKYFKYAKNIVFLNLILSVSFPFVSYLGSDIGQKVLIGLSIVSVLLTVAFLLLFAKGIFDLEQFYNVDLDAKFIRILVYVLLLTNVTTIGTYNLIVAFQEKMDVTNFMMTMSFSSILSFVSSLLLVFKIYKIQKKLRLK